MATSTGGCSNIFVFERIALGRPPAVFLESFSGAELIRNGLGTLGSCGERNKKARNKNLPNKTAARAIYAHTLRIAIQNSNPEFQFKISIQNSNSKFQFKDTRRHQEAQAGIP